MGNRYEVACLDKALLLVCQLAFDLFTFVQIDRLKEENRCDSLTQPHCITHRLDKLLEIIGLVLVHFSKLVPPLVLLHGRRLSLINKDLGVVGLFLQESVVLFGLGLEALVVLDVLGGLDRGPGLG